jgi:hypothetical protein
MRCARARRAAAAGWSGSVLMARSLRDACERTLNAA